MVISLLLNSSQIEVTNIDNEQIQLKHPNCVLFSILTYIWTVWRTICKTDPKARNHSLSVSRFKDNEWKGEQGQDDQYARNY